MCASANTSRGRTWRFADFEYQEVSRKLFAHGEPVVIEAKPLEVLVCLLERPREVVRKGDLLEAVWPDLRATEQGLTTAVRKLRRVFGGKRDSIIHNAAKEGYGMAVPVYCTYQEETIAPLRLQPGDGMPRRSRWKAVRNLSRHEASPVWLARDSQTGEERVFKFALDGARLRALQREVTTYRLLSRRLPPQQQGFLVRVLRWSFKDFPFFMESSYGGEDLLRWSETPQFLRSSQAERIAMAAEVAAGMALAHRSAVHHNDLKPTNLLVSPPEAPGGPPVVRIADFGVASLPDPALLEQLEISNPGDMGVAGSSGSDVGTEMYRAPECRAGAAPTAQSDVYAVGVLLYQLACGNFREPPLPGWEQKIPDPQLRQDIAAAAHLDPASRIETMAELATRLSTFEARQRTRHREEAAEAAAAEMKASLERVRVRRPLVWLAVASLMVSLLAMSWTAYRAVRQRKQTEANNAALSAMYSFLGSDVLGQVSPYHASGSQDSGPRQTLFGAIGAAQPQINIRFAGQPPIAGRLHETLADAYRDLSRLHEAGLEYRAAASRFRAGEGDLSQNAIRADLKRQFATVASMGPHTLEETTAEFAEEEKRIARVEEPNAEVRTWAVLVKTALMGLGSHPDAVLPIVRGAIQEAQSTPGFDPELLLRLKKQLCGTYVRLQDGPNLEREARSIMDLLSRQYDPESHLLIPYRMYVAEAEYLQGKYAEAIAQSDANYARFATVLAPTSAFVVGSLELRAMAEGQMERYPEAARDELAVYAAASRGEDKRMEVGSLGSAAIFECHAGKVQEGIQHARKAMRMSATGADAQPAMFQATMIVLAECLVPGSADASSLRANQVAEARHLLDQVDAKVLATSVDVTDYQGVRFLVSARLALLQGASENARRYVQLARPFLQHANSDPYEVRALNTMDVALAKKAP